MSKDMIAPEQDERFPLVRITKALDAPLNKKRLLETLDEKEQKLFKANVIELYTAKTDLSKCHPQDVLMEAFKAAGAGLSLSKIRKEASIIPYGSTPTLIPEWRGILKMAYDTGNLKDINFGPYYEGELVSFNRMTGKVDLTGQKTSDVVAGFFAWRQLKDDTEKCIISSVMEMQKHGARYAPKNPLWKSDFELMATKTMLKRLIDRFGPKSDKMSGILVLDDDFIAPENDDKLIDMTPFGKSSGPDLIDIETETEVLEAEVEVVEEKEKPKSAKTSVKKEKKSEPEKVSEPVVKEEVVEPEEEYIPECEPDYIPDPEPDPQFTTRNNTGSKRNVPF